MKTVKFTDPFPFQTAERNIFQNWQVCSCFVQNCPICHFFIRQCPVIQNCQVCYSSVSSSKVSRESRLVDRSVRKLTTVECLHSLGKTLESEDRTMLQGPNIDLDR